MVEGNGKKLVYVQSGNTYQAVEVTLGQTSGDMVEVKTGLFEGDLVVTQRAPQFYAQSLRGDRKPKESEQAGHQDQAKVPASKSGVPFPWWWVLPVGSAIATGAFWLGRRSKPSSERFAAQTSNGSKAPNGSAELPVSERVSEFSALAKNHRSSLTDQE